MIPELKKARIEIALLFLLYLSFMPQVYMDYDMGYWQQWAVYIHQHGLRNAYDSGTNYFPIPIYILYFFGKLQGTDPNIIAHINSLKMFFLFFDFLPVFVLCCFRQKILSFKIPYLFLLLNVAYLFNTMVWGQIDGAYANLAFLAIITAILYPVTGALLYLLALNVKPQVIALAPIVGLVLIFSIRNIRTFLFAAITTIAAQFILLLPFLQTGGIKKLIHIATHTVDLYNQVTIFAFNFWYIVDWGNPNLTNDKDTFILFSYKTIGLTLFTISALLVLIPLFIRIIRERRQQIFTIDSYKMLFLAGGMLSLYFFYFNTQMHDRYAHPILIFFFFYGVLSKDYKLYIISSIAYFLSLDKAFPDYPPFIHFKILYAARVIAFWYTAAVVYGTYLWFRNYSPKKLTYESRHHNPITQS